MQLSHLSLKVAKKSLIFKYSAFHLEVPFLPPEMAGLCNINSNWKWTDLPLNRHRRYFRSLWGTKWDRYGYIIYIVDARDVRYGSASKMAPLRETHCICIDDQVIQALIFVNCYI